jgi:hypothetical protein
MSQQASTAEKGYRTRRPHRGLRRLVRVFAWRSPVLNQVFIGKRANMLEFQGDLTVDGYPRCASTFVVEAIAYLHEKTELSVEGQTHNPAHILYAVQQNRPLLVCIRQPRDCCISWAIHQNAPLAECLRFYRDFYEVLKPRIDQLVISDFSFTTKHLNQVFQALNDRFSLKLKCGFDLAEIRQPVFERMEKRDRYVSHTQVMFATPQDSREELKNQMLTQLNQNPPLRRLEKDAQGVYETFLKHALN